MKFVEKYVNFNGKMCLVTGEVIGETEHEYIVDFSHQGIEFRGLWNKEACEQA